MIIDPNTNQPVAANRDVDPLVEMAQQRGAHTEDVDCTNVLVRDFGHGVLRAICLAGKGGCGGQFDMFGKITVQGDLGDSGVLDQPVVETIEHVEKCSGRRNPLHVTVLANKHTPDYMIKVRW